MSSQRFEQQLESRAQCSVRQLELQRRLRLTLQLLICLTILFRCFDRVWLLLSAMHYDDGGLLSFSSLTASALPRSTLFFAYLWP